MEGLTIVFEKILRMGGEAAIVIAAVLLVRMLMKRFPRKYAYLLWLIVGIRLVCPVAVSSSLSLFNLQMIPGQERLTAGRQTEFDTGFAVFGEDKTADAAPAKNSLKPMADTGEHMVNGKKGKEPADSNAISPSVGRTEVLAVVWLAGMMFLLFWNLSLTVRMRHRLQKAVLYQDNIYECDGIASPFVMGLFRPRIYIPFRLGEEEREYILQHERYHIRRRDPVIKAAAFLILSVYWFHPLVWISWLCMTRDMEMSCDEYVLGSMGKDIRTEYSQSLLGFALNRRHLSAGLLAFGETDTRKRIRHVLHFRKKGKWMGIIACIVLLAVSVVCLTNGKTRGSEESGRTVVSSAGISGSMTESDTAGSTRGEIVSSENTDLPEDEVMIGFWKPEDGEADYHYYKAGERDAEKLQKLAEKLDPDYGCTKSVDKKWQKEKETGYIISYQGNSWAVYTGGYVCFLWGKDEKEELQHTVMQLPELCAETDRICKTELGYQRIEPSRIKDVVSAEISYQRKNSGQKTYRQTVHDKSKLETLERILSEAEDMGGSSACPFGEAVLTLKLKDGETIPITWADDDCRVIRINGVYYEYMDRHLSFSPDGIRALFDKIPWRAVEHS